MKVSSEKTIYALELTTTEYAKFRKWEEINGETTQDHLWNLLTNCTKHLHSFDNWGHTLSFQFTLWNHQNMGKTVDKIKKEFRKKYLI